MKITNLKTYVILLLIFPLLLNLFINVDITYADSDSFTKQIKENKIELEAIDENLIDVSNSLRKTELELEYLKEEKLYAEKRLKLVSDRVKSNINDLIDFNTELGELTNSIYDLENDLSEREVFFKKRFNMFYKDEFKIDWFNLVISSEGLSDLLLKLNAYKTIVSTDKKIIDNYINLKNSLESKEEQLTILIESMDKKIIELELLHIELDKALKEKDQLETDWLTKLKELKLKLEELNSDKVDIKEKLLTLELEQQSYELAKKLELEKQQKEALERELADELNTAIKKPELTSNSTTASNVPKKIVKEDVLSLVEKYGSKHGVDPKLILAVIQAESNFNVNAVNLNTNGTTDRGIMQLNSNTAPWLAKRIGIEYKVGIEFIPEYAIEMGTLYLSDHYNEVDYHQTLTSYNRGPGGANKWYKNNGNYITSYSEKVIGYMDNY